MNEKEVFRMSSRVSYKEMVELYNQGFNRLEQKLDELRTEINKANDKIELVHIQATRTNGRVSALESWEYDVNKIIDEIRKENKEQDKKLEVTSKDLAIITLKVTAILSFAGFLIYLATGFVI